MSRRLTPHELNSIAMQLFVQDAATTAVAAARLELMPGPLEWDAAAMEVRRGGHQVLVAITIGSVALAIARGHAGDAGWQRAAELEIARGIDELTGRIRS